MDIGEGTDQIYRRVTTAAWDRSQWWYEGPQFLRWYWDLRATMFVEMNR